MGITFCGVTMIAKIAFYVYSTTEQRVVKYVEFAYRSMTLGVVGRRHARDKPLGKIDIDIDRVKCHQICRL